MKEPGSGSVLTSKARSGSVLTSKAGFGSVLRPIRIRNTGNLHNLLVPDNGNFFPETLRGFYKKETIKA